MDQLEEWAVRGRLATAAKKVRESLARLVVDGQELGEALAEAEQIGLCEKTPVASAGVGQ